jgi:predicted nucleic acid-binding protein
VVWGKGDQEMERAKEIVLDASVAVKWFSEEEWTDLAVGLRNEHLAGRLVLVAPDLLIYEVSNALRHNPGFAAADVQSAVRDLFDLGLDLVPPSEEIFERAAALAFKHKITIYDACYLALAELMGLEFVTGDGKLYRRIKRLKFAKHLRLP